MQMCVKDYLWNYQFVNEASLSIVNGDFVAWNWLRVITINASGSFRRLKLLRHFTAEFQRIQGVINGTLRLEFPVKCRSPVDWSVDITGSLKIHWKFLLVSL